MCTLPIAESPAGVGVTFVDMFSAEGGEGGSKKRLLHVYGIVERFVRDAAAAAAAEPSTPGACCCFVIDGIHELLMCAPLFTRCKTVTL
jgi:hypothetical protein